MSQVQPKEGDVDYKEEFSNMRSDGMVFHKNKEQIGQAVNARIHEIRASQAARTDFVHSFNRENKCDWNLDAMMAHIRTIDISDVDLYRYEPASAVIIGQFMAMVVEDESIGTLAFVAENLDEEPAKLSFRALWLLFRAYDPSKTDISVGLNRAMARKRLESYPEGYKRKRLRADEEDALNVSDFLAAR